MRIILSSPSIQTSQNFRVFAEDPAPPSAVPPKAIKSTIEMLADKYKNSFAPALKLLYDEIEIGNASKELTRDDASKLYQYLVGLEKNHSDLGLFYRLSAIAAVRNVSSLQEILGPIKDKLEKFARKVMGSADLMQIIDNHKIRVAPPAEVETELRNILLLARSDSDGSPYSIEAIGPLLMQGVDQGVIRIGALQAIQKAIPMETQASAVKATISSDVVPAYVAQISNENREVKTTTEQEIASFGRNIFVVMFLAKNRNIFENSDVNEDGRQLFSESRGVLNRQTLKTSWNSILPDEYKKVVEDFRTSPIAPRKQVADPESPNSKGKQARVIFDQTWTEALGKVKGSNTIGDDKLNLIRGDLRSISGKLENVVADVAKSNTVDNQLLNPQVIIAIANAFVNGFVAIFSVEGAARAQAVAATIQILNQYWSDWVTALSRTSGISGGPLKRLLQNAKATGVDASVIRPLALKLAEKLRIGAEPRIQVMKDQACAIDPNDKVCINLTEILQNIQSNANFLFRPKDVTQLLGGEFGVGDFGMAENIIDSYTRVESLQDMDDESIEKMADAILLQIRNWAANRESTEAYDWEDKYMDEGDTENDRNPSQKFNDQGLDNPEKWEAPELVFGSVVLWTLARKLKTGF